MVTLCRGLAQGEAPTCARCWDNKRPLRVLWDLIYEWMGFSSYTDGSAERRMARAEGTAGYRVPAPCSGPSHSTRRRIVSGQFWDMSSEGNSTPKNFFLLFGWNSPSISFCPCPLPCCSASPGRAWLYLLGTHPLGLDIYTP